MNNVTVTNSARSSAFHRYWGWVQKGGWAVMDQALFAGTNFLVGLALARWLAPAAYGAFSTAYSVFLLVGTLHNALWIDPMVTYGSGRFRENYADYQRLLLRYHWRFGLVALGVFVALGLGFLASKQGELGRSFLGLAIASPLVLYLWLARRGAYILLEPRLATFGGGLYLVLYAGLAAGLLRLGWLNETSALAAMGCAAWFSGWWIQQRCAHKAPPNDAEVSSTEVRSLHWAYGRWALLSAFLSWAPANLLFIILPFFESLENIGGLRAILTVFQPPIQVNSALSALLVTVIASLQSGAARRKLVIATTSILTALTVLYCAVFIIFGSQIVNFILGPDYVRYTGIFTPPITTLALFTASIGVLSASFKAVEKPQAITKALFSAAIVGVVLSTLLPFTGALGASWVMAITYAFITLNLAWRWWHEA